ncbi:hypothetical protein LJR219_004309 [Phenylobacterium sp. LjRoot219]|uniref:hypothetical protein n=1 Tax=Phenylobacterium sp. LjRoot219 TaxID=3342283 RepID=UPI003ECDF8DF
MSTVAEYRARAAEAEMIARQMSRRDHKEEALKLARDWSRQAEDLERQERERRR